MQHHTCGEILEIVLTFGMFMLTYYVLLRKRH